MLGRLGDTIRRWLHGSPGILLGPIHRAITTVLLAAVTWRDAVRYRGRPDARLAEAVTITVKTFERPSAIARFVRRARRVFGGRIVVADDSRSTWTSPDPLVDVLALPFNTGVSVGRNAALAAVTTTYVLVADDDFVYTRATDWGRALDYLERNPEVDAVAGIQIELPRWYTVIYDQDPLYRPHADPILSPGTLVDGLPVRLMTPQAYLARTASIRKVGWNQRLRMVDHRDFFSRAAGALVFVQDAAIPVFHARTPWNRFYNRHREDTAADRETLRGLWSWAQ